MAPCRVDAREECLCGLLRVLVVDEVLALHAGVGDAIVIADERRERDFESGLHEVIAFRVGGGQRAVDPTILKQSS